MSIHSPQTFREEAPACFDGVFEWDYLIPAFQRATGRMIQPMDIDAHVEIGGHHLVIETKKEGVEIPGGQRRALLQLWAKGYHTVIFLWGKKDPMACEIYYPSGYKKKLGQKDGPNRVTKQQLQDVCYRWACWANKSPAPFQYREDP